MHGVRICCCKFFDRFYLMWKCADPQAAWIWRKQWSVESRGRLYIHGFVLRRKYTDLCEYSTAHFAALVNSHGIAPQGFYARLCVLRSAQLAACAASMHICALRIFKERCHEINIVPRHSIRTRPKIWQKSCNMR